MKIRYYYESKNGKLNQIDIPIEQVEKGYRQKHEKKIGKDFKLKLRVAVFDMEGIE